MSKFQKELILIAEKYKCKKKLNELYAINILGILLSLVGAFFFSTLFELPYTLFIAIGIYIPFSYSISVAKKVKKKQYLIQKEINENNF